MDKIGLWNKAFLLTTAGSFLSPDYQDGAEILLEVHGFIFVSTLRFEDIKLAPSPGWRWP